MNVVFAIRVQFLFLTVLGIIYGRNILQAARTLNSQTDQAQNGDLFSVWSYDGFLVYEEIIQATENFDSKYCVGEGGKASVYKAELQTGQAVAVKKLHQMQNCEERKACEHKAIVESPQLSTPSLTHKYVLFLATKSNALFSSTPSMFLRQGNGEGGHQFYDMIGLCFHALLMLL